MCAARRTLHGSIRNRRWRAATGWPVLTFGGRVPVWEVCMAGRYHGTVSTKSEVCFLLRCVNAPFSSQILTCFMQTLSVACSSRPISTCLCLYRKRVVKGVARTIENFWHGALSRRGSPGPFRFRGVATGAGPPLRSSIP